MNTFVMALRNLWRYRRRTIISLSVIVFCVGCIVFFKAFVDGFNRTWVGNLLNLYISHIQVHKEGFLDDESLELFIKDYDDVEKQLKEINKVKAVSPRIKTYGLLSVGEHSIGGMILGVNPEKEEEVSTLSDSIKRGSFFDSGDRNSIVVGERMAQTLKLSLDDRLVILTRPYRGGFSVESFYVSGIFKTGNSNIDRSYVYINLQKAQELLEYGDYVNEIAVRIDDYSNAPGVKKKIREIIDNEDLEISSWRDIAPDVYQMALSMDGFVYMILLIAISAASLGILNAILMSTLERTQEFGVMMALGTRPRRLSLLILTESFLIGFIGFVLGSLLGLLVCVLFSINGIDFSAWSEGLRQLGAVDFRIFPKYRPDMLILAFITGVGTSLVAGIYPAIRILRLKVVTALRPIQ